MLIPTLLLSFLIRSCHSSLTAAILCPNSDCSSNNSSGSLILALDSQTDHTVMLFSTIGTPTLLALRYHAAASLSYISVNWTAIGKAQFSRSLILTPQPMDVLAFAVASIIEFDDKNNTAKVSPQNFVQRYVFKPENWILPTVAQIEGNNSIILNYGDKNFTAKLILTPNTNRTHSRDYPHLALAANSTSVDLVLNQFPFQLQQNPPKWSSNNHRLALELYAYKLPSQACSTREIQNIDDEYAPSLFRREDYLVHGEPSREQTYFSFKPAVFGKAQRKASNMTELFIASPSFVSITPNTLLAAQSVGMVFVANALNISGTNISFGIADDGWYNPVTLSFAAIAGFGEPVTDSMSTPLVLTLIVSLGLPGLVIVGGSVWVVYKRLRRKNTSGYEAIQ